MRKVLTVCTGNLCRSPMAEYILQKIFTDQGIYDVVVESAGVAAWEGEKAASSTTRFMREKGFSLIGHITRRLTKDMIDEAELVVVMEKAHLDIALQIAPNASEKIMLMAPFDPDTDLTEVEDPYGQGGSLFEEVYGVIKRSSEVIVNQIF